MTATKLSISPPSPPVASCSQFVLFTKSAFPTGPDWLAPPPACPGYPALVGTKALEELASQDLDWDSRSPGLQGSTTDGSCNGRCKARDCAFLLVVQERASLSALLRHLPGSSLPRLRRPCLAFAARPNSLALRCALPKALLPPVGHEWCNAGEATHEGQHTNQPSNTP